jgi:pimeloyl-ACP methyl ester carboxylesterase
MPTLQARGVEIAWSERGEGPPVLLIHETAATSEVWDGVGAALAAGSRAIGYDRRGWGRTTAPDEYRRTTVEEQSEDAAALVEALDLPGAVVCGAGLGAVIALDLMLRRPELAAGAVLIEPPLLQLLPAATESLSADRAALEAAAGEGRNAIVDLYLSGGLGAIAAGASRLPDRLTGAARERPASLIAELAAVPAWSLPPSRLASAERPSTIVTANSTPDLLRESAAALETRLTGSSRIQLDSMQLPPHLGAPEDLALIVAELAGASR